jgi:hypothetical protein
MKLIFLSIIVLSASLFSLPAAASGSIGADVTKEYAKFYFPIYEEDEYKWHKSSAVDNSLEYAFAINIGNLQAGYFLYKYPGEKEKTGSISALLSSGQISTWQKSDDGYEVIDYHPVDVFYSNPYLVISITNPETLKYLSKFKEVSVFLQGFRSYETKLTITLM